MLTEFDRFCLSHVCAERLRGQENYCPLADEIRNKEHGIITGNDCRRAFEKQQKESEKKP